MFITPHLLAPLQGNLPGDLIRFLPELVICAAIVLLLVLRLFSALDRLHMGSLALVACVLALAASWDQWTDSSGWAQVDATIGSRELFTGLLAHDAFTVFLRLFLYSFAALTVVLTLLTGIPDREDSADFYVLLLGATLGMALMASANHLLMVYIGVEMASLPSYALAGFLKGRRHSSEAALKYVVYGGGASGIMLYGISLLAGKFGTGYLPNIAEAYAATLKVAPAAGFDVILLLATFFLLIGIGFKLAAVPFHFWCPDVFEGAAAEVAAFLSVASKGAALALLGRLVLSLSGMAAHWQINVNDWLPVAQYLAPSLAVFAALTATFGNLAAYRQTNLKRLLAYSTIAHAGYMMMGIAPLTAQGASAVLFYLIVYLLMNLGAFAVVAFLRNQTGSEDLRDFRGLVQRAPLLVVAFGIFLLSLLGVPPLAGFAAKFQIFRVLFDAGQMYAGLGEPGLANIMYALLVIGGLNTVFSAVYYVNALRVMVIEQPPDVAPGREAAPLPTPFTARLYASVLAALIVVVGINWNPLAIASDKGVERFHGPVPNAPVAAAPLRAPEVNR